MRQTPFLHSSAKPWQASPRNEGKIPQISFLARNKGHRCCCVPVDIPQMNFSHMHERLRKACLRRIKRGQLTITLLAGFTGLSKSHLSRFLHADGQLSFKAANGVLKALNVEAEDLFKFSHQRQTRTALDVKVPVLSRNSALFEPEVGPYAVETWLSVPHRELPPPRPLRVSVRQSWRRFIAIRIDHEGAQSLGRPDYIGAIAVIDRHCISLRLYDPKLPNLYAIQDGNQVALGYIDRVETHLVVRPANILVSPKLIDFTIVDPGEYIAGRVALIQHKT